MAKIPPASVRQKEQRPGAAPPDLLHHHCARAATITSFEWPQNAFVGDDVRAHSCCTGAAPDLFLVAVQSDTCTSGDQIVG